MWLGPAVAMDGADDIKWAGEPFNKPNADLVLRTSDAVYFSVHMVVLGLTSDFFDGMAKVPQPCGPGERPIVDVQENSDTLDALLRYMYPCDDPILNDIMRIGDVLRAAVKYQVDPIAQRLKTRLSIFDDPKRVFVVACLADLENEAYQAAVEWSQDPHFDLEDTYVKEMDALSAGTYYRLLHFCDAYKRNIELSEHYKFTRPAPTSETPMPVEQTDILMVPAPFDRPSAHANIVIRSGDNVDFYIIEELITAASMKLGMLLHDTRDKCAKTRDGYRILTLPEPAQVLLPLLLLTYPGVSPHLADWKLLTAVLETAYKYELVRAAELSKRAWVHEIASEPLRSYFVAARQGWEAEARLAAKHALLSPTDAYVPEMETVPAGCYDRLLRYRQRCRRSVIDARRAFVEDEYLMSNLGQMEVYDVFWRADGVAGMFHYRLHMIWARAGVASPGLPRPWAPPPSTPGLGGDYPAHIQQLMELLDMWGGRHFHELIYEYDRYGGQAMDAVDQVGVPRLLLTLDTRTWTDARSQLVLPF